MTTPRKRSSGFTAKPANEEKKVEEFLEEVATEMLETISHIEEVPFVEESILPTLDEGPRFVEKTPEPATPAAPVLVPRPTLPKRHPRNTPRFSRKVK